MVGRPDGYRETGGRSVVGFGVRPIDADAMNDAEGRRVESV